MIWQSTIKRLLEMQTASPCMHHPVLHHQQHQPPNLEHPQHRYPQHHHSGGIRQPSSCSGLFSTLYPCGAKTRTSVSSPVFYFLHQTRTNISSPEHPNRPREVRFGSEVICSVIFSSVQRFGSSISSTTPSAASGTARVILELV